MNRCRREGERMNQSMKKKQWWVQVNRTRNEDESIGQREFVRFSEKNVKMI